jgi:hypothetical protein
LITGLDFSFRRGAALRDVWRTEQIPKVIHNLSVVIED